MLPNVHSIAAAGIKKGARYVGRKAHHALRSGALIPSGGSAKANVQKAMIQMGKVPLNSGTMVRR